MKKGILILVLIGMSFQIKGQVNDTGDKVGIGTANPNQKLHVIGNVGVGKVAEDNNEGLRIEYVDGGSGTTNFKHNRWGGNFYFKRNSSSGEKVQVYIGGSNDHYMNIYNNNNEIKVKMNSGGNSYFTGGNVGIGTTNPDMKLTVKGKIHAEEVKIDLSIPAPDYVFREDYNLRSLNEVEKFIKKNNHLPEIPSAKEFKNNGLMLAEMDMNLLRKVEELTLYTIQQQKEIEIFKKENKKLQKIAEKFNDLQSRLEKLESIK